MVDFHTALGHDLLEIALGNGIAELEKYGIQHHHPRVVYAIKNKDRSVQSLTILLAELVHQ